MDSDTHADAMKRVVATALAIIAWRLLGLSVVLACMILTAAVI